MAHPPITRTEADDAATELVVRELRRLHHETQAADTGVDVLLYQKEARYLAAWLEHHRPTRMLLDRVIAELGEIDTWAHPAAQLEVAS